MKKDTSHECRDLPWVDAYRQIVPYVIKIRTPDSYGSGFAINYRLVGEGRREIAVATAAHVLKHAHDWAELIIIEHSTEETLHTYKLSPSDRIVVVDDDKDIALFSFVESEEQHFPKELPVTLDEKSKDIPPGCPVAWCGFPNIAESSPCFFSGHISATYATAGDYLVDGVVIHGVSGGPCFLHNGKGMVLMGLVSAYYANRSSGEALPGLGLIRSVLPLVQILEGARTDATSRKRTSLKRSAKPSTRNGQTSGREDGSQWAHPIRCEGP